MSETLESVAIDVDHKELAEQLLAQAKEQGVELVGPNGLLNQLTKNVLETALDAEMAEHLGYDKHDPAGRGSGNSRNGSRSKTVFTEIGPVEIEVPRDTNSSFDPVIVKKRQRRLTGVDEIVLSLTAKGLTTGEIAAHFDDVYGATASKDTISKITDKVIEEMTEWCNRPLESVYPVVFIDAIFVKVRDGQVTNRPIYVAIGVTCAGERDILGLWAGDGGEGAKFWLSVLTEIKNRGTADVCIVVCDGLPGSIPGSSTRRAAEMRPFFGSRVRADTVQLRKLRCDLSDVPERIALIHEQPDGDTCRYPFTEVQGACPTGVPICLSALAFRAPHNLVVRSHHRRGHRQTGSAHQLS